MFGAAITTTVLALCVPDMAMAQGVDPAPTPPPVASPAAVSAPQSSARRVGDLDPVRATMLRNRYHVRQMESVLVRAIEHAAEVMSHRLTSVSPDVMALAGAPRAQGFRIEGHGLFFSVEVPRLSDSMAWALQVLNTNRDERTLTSLHRLAEAQTDPAIRADIERAIRLLDRHMTGRVLAEPPGATVAAASLDPAGDGVRSQDVQVQQEARSLLSNPSAAYEDEVKSALADALLDYALTLPVAPGETVTVAARDAGYIAFPDAASEMVTITLSVQVDDLLAFRQQRIDRDEARRRVQVREF